MKLEPAVVLLILVIVDIAHVAAVFSTPSFVIKGASFSIGPEHSKVSSCASDLADSGRIVNGMRSDNSMSILPIRIGTVIGCTHILYGTIFRKYRMSPSPTALLFEGRFVLNVQFISLFNKYRCIVSISLTTPSLASGSTPCIALRQQMIESK